MWFFAMQATGVLSIPYPVKYSSLTLASSCTLLFPIMGARIADRKVCDRLYQKLVSSVPIAGVSASKMTEEIKENTTLPL